MPFVRSLSASLPVRHGVPGGVDGVRPDRPACGVRRLSDRGVHRGRRTRPRTSDGTRLADVPASSMGAGGSRPAVPMLVAAGVGRRRACALPSCLVRARTCRPRGWPWPAGQTHARTLGAGGVRRLADAVRTGPDPSARRSPRTGDVRPTDVERSAMSVARPAAAGCPQGGTDRRRRCSDGCPTAALWRKWAASLTAGVSGTPRCGPRGVHRAVQGWMRGPTSVSDAEACYATDRVDGRLWRRVGQWVSASNSPPSALAAGRGRCSAAGSPGGADRLAAGESLGTSCSGRVQ
jgi:hypothetical protein